MELEEYLSHRAQRQDDERSTRAVAVASDDEPDLRAENKRLTKLLAQYETKETRKLEDKIAQERDDAIRREEIKELKQLLSAEAIKQDMLRMIADHAPLLTPPKLEKVSASGVRPRHTWVLLLSDLQYGQKTRLEASGYVFEQTSEIATEQFKMLWRKIAALHRDESQSKDIERLAILNLGDNVEGDSMRISQSMKVDRPVAVQTVEVTDLESYLLQSALTIFRYVDDYRVGGNHDRISSKPGTAGLGELDMRDTYAWLSGEFLKRMHANAMADGRLTIKNNESWFGADIIAGHKFVYEHGASFKSSTGSYGGVSFYSIANAARGYMSMLGDADIVAFGHFHQPMILPIRGGHAWQIVNGAFPPSTEFVQSNFKGFGRPCQWLLDFDEEHGMVDARPIYVDTPNMMRPGQFWDGVRERGVA